MKVQKIKLSSYDYSWIVIDETDYQFCSQSEFYMQYL